MLRKDADAFITRNYKHLLQCSYNITKSKEEQYDLLHFVFLIWVGYIPNSKVKTDEQFCKNIHKMMRTQYKDPTSDYNKEKYNITKHYSKPPTMTEIDTYVIDHNPANLSTKDIAEIDFKLDIEHYLAIIDGFNLNFYKRYVLSEIFKKWLANGGNVAEIIRDYKKIPQATIYRDFTYILKNLKRYIQK